MQDDLILIFLLMIIMVGALFLIAAINAKMNKKFEEIERKILKIETILEERKI